jgi:hypothetical protein
MMSKQEKMYISLVFLSTRFLSILYLLNQTQCKSGRISRSSYGVSSVHYYSLSLLSMFLFSFSNNTFVTGHFISIIYHLGIELYCVVLQTIKIVKNINNKIKEKLTVEIFYCNFYFSLYLNIYF